MNSDPLVKRSLRASIKDGLCWSVMSGLGESYLNAYAIFLKALPLQIGIISALPALAAALSQHIGVFLFEHFKKRTVLLQILVGLHGALWIPIAFLCLFLPPSPHTATILLFFLLVYFSVGGAAGPIWNSLIGDLVPASSRGQYFALRNRLISVATFISLLLGGYLLQVGQQLGIERYGFLLIFIIAGVSRMSGVHYLKQHFDPPFHIHTDEKFSLLQFLRATPRSNFARFALYQGSINFGLQLAAPFFSLFMLRHLHFSYLAFTLQSAMIILGQILTFSHWGQLSDRFGTKRILNVCSVGVCINPLLWLFTDNYYLLMANHLFAGAMWAGFNLSIGNFLFDAVMPSKRARCAAYVGIINGVASIGGALIGGYMLTHDYFSYFTTFSHPNFQVLFALSALVRVAGAGYFLPRIQEVRDVENVRTKDFIFRVLSVKPFSGMSFSIISRKILPHQEKKDDP